MTKSGIVLSVENLSKSFGAVNAITDVSFDVYEHEVVALVGDNAAGKSTIARIISGAYEQSSGVIRLCGEEVQICSAHEALELGVATVFQDLALCENLDVTANIFLGRELHDGTRLLAEEDGNLGTGVPRRTRRTYPGRPRASLHPFRRAEAVRGHRTDPGDKPTAPGSG